MAWEFIWGHGDATLSRHQCVPLLKGPCRPPGLQNSPKHLAPATPHAAAHFFPPCKSAKSLNLLPKAPPHHSPPSPLSPHLALLKASCKTEAFMLFLPQPCILSAAHFSRRSANTNLCRAETTTAPKLSPGADTARAVPGSQ